MSEALEKKEIKWSDDQKNAINADGSVLLSAAAGSGKTAVLAQHVIRLITGENPINADELLVLTFTRDAAAEMKKRIQDDLDKRLKYDRSDSNLLRQKQKLYSSYISTTDSFCSSIVRENFNTLKIARDFRIASNDEVISISAKALDAAFETFYKSNSPSFRQLIKAFSSGNSDLGLRNVVLDVHGFLQNQPFQSQWLDKLVEHYTNYSFAETKWAQELISALPDELDKLYYSLKESLELAKSNETLDGYYLDLLSGDIANIESLIENIKNRDWNSFCALAEDSFINNYINSPKLDLKANKDIKSEIKTIDSCRESVKDSICEKLGADKELKEIGNLIVTLTELLREYDKELKAIKDKRNIRTFSDVSLLAVKLLAESCNEKDAQYQTGGFFYRPTELAKVIASRFKEVIVDEYQDVNLIQEVIYNCVSQDGNNLFMVGDIKQSIYGFRQSKAKLFSSRKNNYPVFDRENISYPATIFLSKNFRSRRQVCDTVNFIFSRIMPDYTPEEFLNFGAKQYKDKPNCDTEISLIYKDNFADDYSTTALEAKYTSGRILDMINSGFTVTEKDGERPVEFRDFAVLMRAKSGSDSDEESKQKGSAEFVKQLGNYGIPAYCEESENFFSSQEIKLVINILKVIDNPSNDIALLSVLLSPIFGFTPDDLAIIRAKSKKTSLYRSLNIYKKEDSPTGKKADKFLAELKILRDFASVSTVDELLERIYERTAIVAVTAAVKGGESPEKNLELMRVYARKFCANGYKTLSDFNNYIERLVKNGKSLASAANTTGNTSNCVKVMSIHKSKGLEFPVCFVVDIARKFNETDFNKPLLMDSESFIGIKPYINYSRKSTLPYKAITQKKLKERTEEELRMLYVALTRAKEKLIIVGTENKFDSLIQDISSKTLNGSIDIDDVYYSKRMLDWIMLSAAVNPSTCTKLNDSLVGSNDFSTSWKLNKIQTEEELFCSDYISNKEISHESNNKTQPDYLAILNKNLAFEYPNADIIGIPQKVSPSQVSHSESRQFSGRALIVPDFEKNTQKLSPTEIGTAHHEFLHYCDFNAARADIQAEIDRLLKTQKLTERQCNCLDTDKLSAILFNPLFERIIKVYNNNPDSVYREKQFTVFVHPSMTTHSERQFKPDRKQIVDGEVDLVFVEDGELVIVDYKTDRIKDIAELAHHKPQLDLYEHAMSQVLEIPVKEKIIFSITLNDFLVI